MRTPPHYRIRFYSTPPDPSRLSGPITPAGRINVAKGLEYLGTFRPHPDPVAVHPPVLPISDDEALAWAQAEPERMALPWSAVKSLAWLEKEFGR